MIYKARDKRWYPWMRGLNAYTFKILHGAYPTNEMIRRNIEGFRFLTHRDCKLWNMIIQGKVRLIDFDDSRFSCSKRIHQLRIEIAQKIFQDNAVWRSDSFAIMKKIRRLYKTCKKFRNPSKFFDF